MTFRRWLLLASLAVALACGKSKEEERFDRVRAVCEGLVGQTIGDAIAKLGEPIALVLPLAPDSCPVDLTSWSARDTCAYDGETAICDGSGWSFWANDQDLCEAGGCVIQPDGSCRSTRCWYGCLVRYAAADVVPSEDEAVRYAIPICASRFVSGEPAPPVR